MVDFEVLPGDTFRVDLRRLVTEDACNCWKTLLIRRYGNEKCENR